MFIHKVSAVTYCRVHDVAPFSHITFRADRRRRTQHCSIQESCAIAKMTARCVSRCGDIRPVAEIWPFKIFPRWRPFQDGGGRHLGFVQTGNSAIRSAVPENPTLEQNRKWIGVIGRPVAEISPLEIFPTWRWPPSWICSNRK